MVRLLKTKTTYKPDCACEERNKKYEKKKDAIAHEQECIGHDNHCEYRKKYQLLNKVTSWRFHYHSNLKSIENCNENFTQSIKRLDKVVAHLKCGNGHPLTYIGGDASIYGDGNNSLSDLNIQIFCGNVNCSYNAKYLDLMNYRSDSDFSSDLLKQRFSDLVKDRTKRNRCEQCNGTLDLHEEKFIEVEDGKYICNGQYSNCKFHYGEKLKELEKKKKQSMNKTNK